VVSASFTINCAKASRGGLRVGEVGFKSDIGEATMLAQSLPHRNLQARNLGCLPQGRT
jgi:hypothetical protein